MGFRLVRVLLGLTPREFRREFGDEILAVVAERWEERAPTLGPVGRLRFWAAEGTALIAAAVRMRRRQRKKRGGVMMEGFVRDVKYAARSLARQPAFAMLTVLTLGLGIGASTAIFSAVNAVLLEPLPYDDPESVVVLFNEDRETGERRPGVSAANTRDFRESATLFDAVAVAEPWGLDLRLDGRTETLRTWAVSEGFFEAIGAEAVLGRTFTRDEYDGAASAAAVLSHSSYVTRFGGDPSILGSDLQVDGQTMTVVGIMPPAFRFPDAAEVWIPRQEQPWDEGGRPADFMTGVARIASDVPLARASQEATQIATVLREAHPRVNADLDFDLVPLREHLFGSTQTGLFVLVAAVGFLLMIACANVAGLMLARGARRERGSALRGALGAGTARLVTQISAESALIAIAGCGIGVLIAYGGVAVIEALAPPELPRIDEIAIDGTVLGFALLLSALSAGIAGIVPSWRLSRPDLRSALGDGARGSIGNRTAPRARARLVVVQVASAVVLVCGAGLLVRSFDVLLDRDLGFDPAGRVVTQVFAYDYETPEATQSFLDEAATNMEALPGVTGVALTTSLPASNDGVIASIDINVPVHIESLTPPPEGQEPQVTMIMVSENYFGTVGTDLLDGRDFLRSDDADGAPVVIVNEAFVRRTLAGLDPLGELIRVSGPGDPTVSREIVGVVRDTRPLGHASEPRPEVYLPLRQVPSGSLTFVVHTEADADELALPVMEAIWAANPGQAVWGTTTLEGLVAVWLQERRFTLFLLSAFSAIALALASVGLYGLVSYSVEQRLGELGIRRALGGKASDLLKMVLAEGTRLGGTGVVIGLGAAWFLSRYIEGMLFEVSPTDPLTFVSLGAFVLAIAAVASLVPAVRAVRVDPVEALRAE